MNRFCDIFDDLQQRNAGVGLIACVAFTLVMLVLAYLHHLAPDFRASLLLVLTGGLPEGVASVAALTLSRAVLSPGFWLMIGTMWCL